MMEEFFYFQVKTDEHLKCKTTQYHVDHFNSQWLKTDLPRVLVSFKPLSSMYLFLMLLSVLSSVHGSCKSRHLTNSTYGIITDGPGEYEPSTHCQWLIKGKYIETCLGQFLFFI